VIGMTKS